MPNHFFWEQTGLRYQKRAQISVLDDGLIYYVDRSKSEYGGRERTLEEEGRRGSATLFL